MHVVGGDYLTDLSSNSTLSLKMVVNGNAAIVFPDSLQHRDQRVPGVFYEDNYQGNALAALIRSGRIEVRYHDQFSDRRVAAIFQLLFTLPELSVLKTWDLYYQGKLLRT